jgi:hypothetical protein
MMAAVGCAPTAIGFVILACGSSEANGRAWPEAGRSGRSKMATTRVSSSARRQCVVEWRDHFCFGLIAAARTPDGVSPNRRRNTRLKWDTSPKPAARAISTIARCRRRRSVSIANARSSRCSTRRSVNDCPVSSSSRWMYRRDRPSLPTISSRSKLGSLNRRAISATTARSRVRLHAALRDDFCGFGGRPERYGYEIDKMTADNRRQFG